MGYLVIFGFFRFRPKMEFHFRGAFSFAAENDKCIFGRPLLHQLFQITPYVNDFQTLNNPGSGQAV